MRMSSFAAFWRDYDDVLALMKSSRVFASPSTREGFGMAALEANACGLPVVTVKHRMNAVMDLVTEQTGIVCEPTAGGSGGRALPGAAGERCHARAVRGDGKKVRLGGDMRRGRRGFMHRDVTIGSFSTKVNLI